jgi:hypothetical protein
MAFVPGGAALVRPRGRDDKVGFSVRRAKKVGPFRFTASKSGIGVSVGGKYGRVSRGAKGRVTTTVRAPGTGVSWSDSKSPKSKARTVKRTASQKVKAVPTPEVETRDEVLSPPTLPGASPLPPQGWYADPDGIYRFRWWDGARWTEHTA